jgi:hypothetical protein
MTSPGGRIRAFCAQHGLAQAETDYLLGVVGEALLLEREACAVALEALAARTRPYDPGVAAVLLDGASLIRARKE